MRFGKFGGGMESEEWRILDFWIGIWLASCLQFYESYFPLEMNLQ